MGILSRVLFTFALLLSTGHCDQARAVHCPDHGEMIGDEPPDGTGRGCVKRDNGGKPVRHGPWVEWYINGQKHSEGSYADGKRVGLWTWWHVSGQKMQEGNYLDGAPAGAWSAWDEEGKKLDNKPKPGGKGLLEESPTMDDFSRNMGKAFKGK